MPYFTTDEELSQRLPTALEEQDLRDGPEAADRSSLYPE